MGIGAKKRADLAPFLVSLFINGCATTHLMQAEHAYNQRRYEDARVLAELAVREDPRSVPAAKLLGRLLVRSGADALERNDVEEAKRYFEEASRLIPRDPNVDPYLDLIGREERGPEQNIPLPNEVPEKPAKRSTRKERPRASRPIAEAPPADTSRMNALTAVRESALYDAPSPFAAKVQSISAGNRLQLIRDTGGWFEVETKEGRRGYIKGDSVKKNTE